jgi:hypothetical protein
MSLLHRFLARLGFRRDILASHQDVESFRTLISELAVQEQRSESEIHAG